VRRGANTFFLKKEEQMEEQKKKIPRLYSSLASYYDKLEGQYRNHDEDSRWIQGILEKNGATNLLDLSCGTGSHVSRLAKISDAEVFAMDSSPEMVSIAHRKTRESNQVAGEVLERETSYLRADFFSLPFKQASFDAAICMYWSLAGLNEKLAWRLFAGVNSILATGGVFIFDVENSEGIKENLIGTPFIDAFFAEDNATVMRANLSRKVEPDLVDWRAYYIVDDGRTPELFADRMDLRFYSRSQLERTLAQTNFETLDVLSGPFKPYSKGSPSLYFVARKKEEGGGRALSIKQGEKNPRFSV
jgi:SAM-dependent methyltransferase